MMIYDNESIFSCFLFLDLPGIVSGSTVAFLDPHEIYFGKGESGRQFNIEHGLLQPLLFDQFAPFHGIFGCDLSSGRPYKNTLFRFPLRKTLESKLSKTIYNESMIDNLYESMRQEASIMLLFLKSVQSICIYKRTNDGESSCVFKVEMSSDTRDQVMQERKKLLEGAIQTTCFVQSKCIIGINVTKDRKIKSERWLVVNRIDSGNKRISELRTKLCLIPWIGLAVPIDKGHPPIRDGRIFCFLPLPPDVDCTTGLPVHIHGYFGLTDNRRGLTWPGMECQNNETAEWNKLLLTEISSITYCKMLEALVTNQPNTDIDQVSRSRLVYSGIPVLKDVRGHWQCIMHPMFQQMISQPVFYALKNSGNSWVSLDNGVLDLLHQSGTSIEGCKVILKVVCKHYAVITDLPTHVLEIVQKYFPSSMVISPAIVRNVLKISDVIATVHLREEKLYLLDYVLSDDNRKDISGISLLPLANKNFVAFCKHKHSSNPNASVLVSSGSCTAELLPNMAHRTLDESLPENIKSKLYKIAATKNNVIHSTQLVRLTNQIVAANIRTSLPQTWFKGNVDKVLWRPGTSDHPPKSWLEAMWKWINEAFPTSLSQFEGIPLLPIGNYLGILSKHSKFVFSSEGIWTKLPTQVCDFLSVCGCTVLANIPRYINCHKDINTYVAPPTPSGVFNVLSRISIKVLVTQAAQNFTSEHRLIFREFILRLPRQVFDSHMNLFLKLPLFETLHGTVTAAHHHDAVSENLNLPTDFKLSKNHVLILSTDSNVQKLLCRLNVRVLCRADTLMQYVFPDISSNRCYDDQHITVLMRWIFERIAILQSENQSFHDAMRNLSFIPTQSGNRKRPNELYDPSDAILRIFLDGKNDVFPTGFYATHDSISKLRYIGLKTKQALTATDLFKFAQMIASSARSSPLVTKKVSALLAILNENPSFLDHYSSHLSLREDLNNLRWIPCATNSPSTYPNFVQLFNSPTLFLPSEVRNPSKTLLIGSSMPTLAIEVNNNNLQQTFGFMRDPPLSHVINQLQIAIASWKAQEERSISGIEVAKFQEMLVVIYCFLSKFRPNDVSTAMSSVSLKDWIWHGKGFCAPRNVALSTDFTTDLRPQLFLLAGEFCSNKSLIKFFLQHGVSQKFSNEDILGALKGFDRNMPTLHNLVTTMFFEI